MPALRTAAVATALAAATAVAPSAHATDDRVPVARCTHADVESFIPYTGYAYVTSATTPLRLTIVCAVDNGDDRSVSQRTSEGVPFVAILAVGTQLVKNPMTVCVSATAEYADGATFSTSYCGDMPVP